ncbi:MAG: hypothetical protein ACRDRO_06340 [Pseudonocardiaceae bacterium]
MSSYPQAPADDEDPYYTRWTANMDQCTGYAREFASSGNIRVAQNFRDSRWSQFDEQIKEDLAEGRATTWQPRDWS